MKSKVGPVVVPGGRDYAAAGMGKWEIIEVGSGNAEGGKQTEGNPFSAVQSVKYGSSSTNARRTDFAWGVDFGNGSLGRHSKTSDNYVRCVKFCDTL